MNELIAVKPTTIGSKEVKSVSARDLYLGLGLNESHWKRWASKNIRDNNFFSQDADFIQLSLDDSSFAIMANERGNFSKDYAISIEMAKHLTWKTSLLLNLIEQEESK